MDEDTVEQYSDDTSTGDFLSGLLSSINETAQALAPIIKSSQPPPAQAPGTPRPAVIAALPPSKVALGIPAGLAVGALVLFFLLRAK